MHGAHKARTFGRAMRRKGRGHTLLQRGIDAVIGKRGAHHALVELGKVAELHRHVKAPLGHLLPGAAGG